MDFTKYSSLTNVSQKFINKITEQGYADIPYIVNEKVHGANFGIHWDAENGVSFSKRSGFLEESEVFYAHTKIADEFEGNSKGLLGDEKKQVLKLINNEARSVLLEIWTDLLEDY